MTQPASLFAGQRRRALVALAAALACGFAPRVHGETAGPSQPAEGSAATKAAATTVAPCAVFRVRPQDEVWAISTRWLGCPSGKSEPRWTVWKYDAQTPRWNNASSADFYGADSADVTTAIYLHGNQMESGLALQDGLNVYFELAGKLDDERPVRFVIWSWPSAKIRGPLRDVRSKADRTDVDAYYLARFLADMQSDVQVGLLGFSYGARIIAGGLHLLDGGELAGQTVPTSQRPEMRVAFWAAAEHDDWLLPGRYHGRAIDVADRWLITRNCRDPVLTHYRFVEKCDKPAALGYSGLVGRNLLTANQNARIEELDVTPLLGGTHDLEPYLYAPAILNRTRNYVLWHAQ